VAAPISCERFSRFGGARGAIDACGYFRCRLGGEGKTSLRDDYNNILFDTGIFFEPPKQKGKYSGVDFVCIHKEEGIHSQTLITVRNRVAQANARGATQILDRGGQAVACGSCLSQVLDRGAEPLPAAPYFCSPQVLT
jgi:hypothetical protein